MTPEQFEKQVREFSPNSEIIYGSFNGIAHVTVSIVNPVTLYYSQHYGVTTRDWAFQTIINLIQKTIYADTKN